MRILIAYDGSDYAKAAIDDLRRAGLPRDASARVISAADTHLPSEALAVDPSTAVVASHRVAGTLAQARAQTEHATGEAGDCAREGTTRVRRCFPAWEVSAEPVVGTAAQAIVQTAEGWAAHLTVLGSHGRSALGRLLLGSVSRQVASDCVQSVRVARHVTARGNTPVRVIVGVDGSDGAAAAMHAVLSRHWPAGTEVRVVAVDDTVRPTGTVTLVATATQWINESNDRQAADMAAMVHQAVERLREAGVDVSMQVEKGAPRDVLNEEARQWVADCIVVGARGTTADRTSDGVGLGRVATGLVASAPCSVEITRRPPPSRL